VPALFQNDGGGPARACRMTAIDFETTGSVRGWPTEPWQLGLVELDAARVVPRSACGRLLHVPPDRPFNPYAPGRHAQIRDALADAPSLPSLLPELAPALLGRPLVAHNTGTERAILRKAFPMHAFGPWIDTLALARAAFPGRTSYALEDLVPALGLAGALADALEAAPGDPSPPLAPHDAVYDAVAAAVLLAHILSLDRWSALAVDDLAELSRKRK